ncbi:MAG: rhomboid family intramembrane serine protease [Methanobacteriota archaeon]|nr:MAG: rhomboid family intramembrane serine protease [Euryarchaeota archaeon]
MIPLRDSTRSSTFPYITIIIIVVNSVIFLYEVSLGEHLNAFLNTFGLIPARMIQLWEQSPMNLLAIGIPFFSSIFLHGGWMHLIGNMWFLWIFGDNVEDSMGHGRFVLFYLLTGVGANLIHAFVNISSTVPTIGASGAIAGVMGAYMMTYPRGRVLTLIPIIIFIHFAEIPAWVFLLIWIAIQTFQGIASLGIVTGGGVAWWAHIGGFILGAILIFLFRKHHRSPPSFYVEIE